MLRLTESLSITDRIGTRSPSDASLHFTIMRVVKDPGGMGRVDLQAGAEAMPIPRPKTVTFNIYPTQTRSDPL